MPYQDLFTNSGGSYAGIFGAYSPAAGAAAQGGGSAKLSAWYRSLAANPANSYLLFLGDSTSYEPNDLGLYSRLRSVHTLPGKGLAGMVGNAQHIVSGGNNGASLAAWWATTGSGTHSYTDGSGTFSYADTKALYATAEGAGGHLCIVFSFGLNDLRLAVDQLLPSGSAYTTFQSLLGTVIAQLRTDMPNASVVLRIPNPATTDDVGAAHYVQSSTSSVNPAGGAQALTDALRTAYLSYADEWPNVVVWNSQNRIFGRTAVASTQSTLWANQIHPSATGYANIADGLVADVLGLAQPSPSRLPAITAGGAFDGLIATTTQPWTIDPHSLEDSQHFALVGEYGGTDQVATGQTYIRFGPVSYTAFQINDVLQVATPSGTFALVPSAFFNSASGGAIPNTQATIPAFPSVATSATYSVRVYREIDQGDALLALMRQIGPLAYPYVKLGRIAAGGSSFVQIQAEPNLAGTPSARLWNPAPTDALYVAGSGVNPLDLSAATKVYTPAQGYLQLNGVKSAGAGWDATTYVGRLALIIGAHQPEVVGNITCDQTTLNGTTTGTAVSSQPFVGGPYKKALVHLNGYENTTATAQTITYPTAFTTVASIIKDDSGGASSSLTTLTLPASMVATKTGVILIEGY